MKAFFAVARAAALAALLGSPCVFAADATDPERLAEARALLDAMHLDRQIDGMAGAMAESMSKQWAQGEPSLNVRVLQISMEEAMLGMKEQARSPGGLIDTLADAYASQFTFAELRRIREFYESPAGQHMLQATPEVMKQVFPQMAKAGRVAAPRVCANVKARLIAEHIEGGAAMACPAAP